MSPKPYFKETAWIFFQGQLPLFPDLSDPAYGAPKLGDTVALDMDPTLTIGEITKLDDFDAIVSIPEHMKIAFPRALRNVGEVFDIRELVKTEGFSLEQMAEAYYSGRYDDIYPLTRAHFNGWQTRSVMCQCVRCHTKAIGVGIINYLGTVYPIAMCEEHTNLHGCLTGEDGFIPILKI